MDSNVVALGAGRPAFLNLYTLLTDFAEIGLYHSSIVRGILTPDELLSDIQELVDDSAIDIGDGWIVVGRQTTVAVRTMLRLAAVTEDRAIPYEDVAKSIVKMAEWGPENAKAKDRKDIAGRWAEYFEVLPSRPAIRALAAFIGATDTGKGIDFSPVKDVIEPTVVEQAVLDAIEMQFDLAAPSSRLCREARKRLPSNSKLTVDYRSLKKIPFVLKPDRENNRLIGFQPDARLASKPDQAGLVCMTKDPTETRIILEYLVSEENVEGNSFNVPVEIKPIIAGRYLNSVTGTTIALNTESKFAQKLTGIGAVIREAFPDYISGQRCFVKLDKINNRADVELIGANDFDGAIEVQSWLTEDLSIAA